MYSVKVTKECGCFRKSDYKNNQQFNSKDDALITALNMAKDMNQNFCQKHKFEVKEDGDSILILVEDNKKSCCGGGHC
jgi:hypothetical protein